MAQISAAVQKIFRAVPNIGLRASKNQDILSFVEFTNSTTIEKALTEFAARICYNSVKRIGSAPNFVEGILKSGHLSTAEHASLMLPVRSLGGEAFSKTKTLDVNRYFDFPKGYVAGNLRSWLELMAIGDYNPLYEYIVTVFPDVFPSGPYMNEVELYEFSEQAPINVPPFESQYGTPNIYLLAVNRGELDVSRRPDTKVINPWVRYTWLVEGVSRSLTHQLVRHRGLSFCLAGDTVVPSFGKKFFTMRQLWEYQEQNKNGPLQQLRLRGMDEERRLIPVKIKRVINSGFQQLYQLKTESGRVIRATENHKFLTATDGWKALKDLQIGDELLANGVEAYKNEEFLRLHYLQMNKERKVLAKELGISDACLGKWIAKFGLQKPGSQQPNRKPGRGKVGMFSEEQRRQIGLSKRGDKNHNWKGDEVGVSGARLRVIKVIEAKECSLCGATVRVQRHHIDHNPLNDDVANIKVLCEPCHKAFHAHLGGTKTVFRDKIVSIEIDEIEETFDLEIDHPCHNFVAAGLVVHNSQESQRYVDFQKGRESKNYSAFVPVPHWSDEQNAKVFDAYENIVEYYEELRKDGSKKEDARFILPNAASTRLVVSGNLPELLHFLKLRCAKDAQWEIRRLALAMLGQAFLATPTPELQELMNEYGW